MPTPLLMLDFDGVVADSEVPANQALADLLTELGCPTTLDQSIASFVGKRTADFMPLIADRLGKQPPDGFLDTYRERTYAALRRDVRPVAGVLAFIEEFDALPRCIASSSSPERLALCIQSLGIGHLFGANVFSATEVARGKPFPDIFLHAARQMGVNPSDCIVIEDSTTGVQAGIAAGMTVIGLLAAGHIRPGHRERLAAAGAHHVAESYAEVAGIVRSALG